MSVIGKATVEQITEALSQTTRGGTLGKWAWQAFIEQGSKMGFEYLLQKIINNAIESLRCDSHDVHEATMTTIAIASITRESKNINMCRRHLQCDDSDKALEAMVELACLTGMPKDVAEIRGFVRNKRINGYYLVKALLLIASQDEASEDSFIDSVMAEAKKIKNPLLRARALAEICKISKRNEVDVLLRDIAQKGTENNYLDSRIYTLGLYSNCASWAIDQARRSAEYYKNPRRAESFMALASITKEFGDLERAYDGAEKTAEEKPNQIWCSLIRIYAGID